MPTPPKAADAMAKNLTHEELELRAAAEAEIMPDRGGHVTLVPPPLMKGNPPARRYWNQILKRMDGYAILDDLDSDTLGIYCVMLSRYDGLCKDLTAARSVLAAAETSDGVETALAKLDTLNGKMQRLEGNILQYAERLGLTPSGRIRLAQKRAEQIARAQDPDGDLFGD